MRFSQAVAKVQTLEEHFRTLLSNISAKLFISLLGKAKHAEYFDLDSNCNQSRRDNARGLGQNFSTDFKVIKFQNLNAFSQGAELQIFENLARIHPGKCTF